MEKRYRKFIEKVCETASVWVLESGEGYATSDSGVYENEEGEAYALFCFWSEEHFAQSCAVDAWCDYLPKKIALSDFIENWCVAMSDDEALAGIDFDPDMSGYEQEPLQLIMELAMQLKNTNKKLAYKKFKKIDELTDIIKNLGKQ